MKIRVDEIPPEGLTLDIEEDLKGAGVLEKAGFSLERPVKGSLVITPADGDIFVRGHVRTSVRLTCSRCLKEFTRELDLPVSLYYSREKVEEREKELHEGDMDVSYLYGSELDTIDILAGVISIEIPIKPLCSAECKGLCPRCGHDLNEGPCSCEPGRPVDERFAKLKDFKIK